MIDHPRSLTRHPRAAIAALGWGLLFAACASGCYREPPSRWDTVQQETRGRRAVSRDVVPGGDFNRYFPRPNSEYDVVYTQERPGFAEAHLVQRGTGHVASLAIFDTVSNPTIRDEYRESTETLAGFPAMEKGTRGTAVLVNDRFQVQVRSLDANFTRAQREEWLRKFDLANLRSLQ